MAAAHCGGEGTTAGGGVGDGLWPQASWWGRVKRGSGLDLAVKATQGGESARERLVVHGQLLLVLISHLAKSKCDGSYCLGETRGTLSQKL